MYRIFDIETRVDKELLRRVLYPNLAPPSDWPYGPDEYAYRKEVERLVGLTGEPNPMVAIGYHVPISIAVGKVDEKRRLEDIISLPAHDEYSEPALLRAFWRGALNTLQAGGTFVTFNGRTFDFPVLEFAALRSGIRIPSYFGKYGPRYRYQDDHHFDMLDFLLNHGSVQAKALTGGLNWALAAVGLPVKTDVTGADVQRLYEAGELERIHSYCRSDVLSEYGLFLRIEVIRGNLLLERALELTRDAYSRFGKDSPLPFHDNEP